MSLNEGISETFIFHVKQDIFKVVLNFTKGMCTVYAPNGRILVRMEKLHDWQLNKLKRKITTYLNRKKTITYDFFKGGVIR